MMPFPRGFSLIETLVYIGLTGMLMTGALVSAYALAESTGRNRSHAHLLQEGAFIENVIVRTLQGTDIESPAAHASGGVLSLHTHDGTKIRISEDDGLLRLSKDGAAMPLSDQDLPEGIRFTRGGDAGSAVDPEHLSFSFVLSARTNDGLLVSGRFDRTIYLSAP